MNAIATPLDDRRALRTTLGQFATGVAIVTARRADGERAGVTINSFASASLAPPLVLWSLAAGAASRPVFEEADHHAINVLAATQDALARRFATPMPDRFAGVAVRKDAFGALAIEGALSLIVCRVRDRRETGDHVLFVCEVVHHQRFEGAPLIFHASRYWEIGEPVDAAATARFPGETNGTNRGLRQSPPDACPPHTALQCRPSGD